MKVLIALTYYRPHYSGLTIYTERLARALATRGHQVTVLTSRFRQDLPAQEFQNGVDVRRIPVWMRISKGVIMPGILLDAWIRIQHSDVVNLHVPQLDAAPIAVLSRLAGKPVVLTYHCDLHLPKGVIHWIANQVSHIANHISAMASNVIVTNTQDYAENSPFLRRYLHKVHIIPPSIILDDVTEDELADFRQKYDLKPGQIIIGMVARLATEKGVEFLISALPRVLETFPSARVLLVGQYENVLGEERYAAMLAPRVKELGDHWSFLGVISPKDLAAFYHECDVTVLPSINVTESFGMVQVESIVCGTPVVSTNLPGVRQPILSTGMGKVVAPRDVAGLSAAIIDVLQDRDAYRGDIDAVRKQYAPLTIAKEYETIFQELCKRG